MSLTSYRAAPPRVGDCVCVCMLGRPGGDRLSRTLGCSIIGAGGFHVRVRDGIGCRLPAMATRSSKHQTRSAGRWTPEGGLCVGLVLVCVRRALSPLCGAGRLVSDAFGDDCCA